MFGRRLGCLLILLRNPAEEYTCKKKKKVFMHQTSCISTHRENSKPFKGGSEGRVLCIMHHQVCASSASTIIITLDQRMRKMKLRPYKSASYREDIAVKTGRDSRLEKQKKDG